MHQDVARILFSEAQITAGIDRLAGDVTRAYADRPFTVVAVLKGSCVFVADLIRRIPVPLQLAFVGASSYRERDRPGALELGFFPLERELRGQHLLLVDDILDTGRTLSRLKAELEQRGAASVASCVFLDKPSRRSIPFEPDFRCFEVEDVFVVGYGLDYAGHYRNLPYVGALAERVWARPEVLSKRD